MVFSAPLFLFVFLPGVLLAGLLAPARWRNTVLLVASLVFYWWGSGGQLVLLLVSIAFNRFCIARISAHRGPGRSPWLVVDVVGNILALGFFKYGGFFLDSLQSLNPTAVPSSPGWVDVALPIGISFFTFQAMSAAVDVHRGEATLLPRRRDFALFISFFPQLIAGPIVRYADFAPQLLARRLDLDKAYGGVARFTLGLGKKVLVADNAAVAADAVFGSADPTTPEAWIGALAYTVQIYFDFSGYSDMAIGLGSIFGFDLPENFRRPYSARTMTEFWQRWHITLSSWFRDYLYIPLGGSRRSEWITYRNLAIVFLVTGLWHGAAWTFVVWGMFHGVVLVVERATDSRFSESPVRWAVTFLLVVLGWVIFRAESLGVALDLLARMTVDWQGGISPVLAYDLSGRAAIAIVAGLASLALPRDFVTGMALSDTRRFAFPGRVAAVTVLLPVVLLAAAGSSFSPFLYFQF